ncbi:GNAT family N-acetyltransferase [Noviherbaspirillum agri]
MLTCRPVESKDLPSICAFPRDEDELFFMYPKAVFPLTPDQLQQSIAARRDSTVAELGGELVAFANFYRWGEEGCAIGNVIVSPSARGKGVARYLVAHMVELAFSTYSAKEVSVSCFNENVAGLLLYPRLGFAPYAVEERKDRNGKRVALIHMRIGRDTRKPE